jgi:hypothetical protein
MRTFVSQLFVILVLLVSPLIVHAGDLTHEQLQALREVSNLISVVHEVADQQLVTKEEAAAAESRYVEKGRKIVGRDVTAAEIHKLASGDKNKALRNVLDAIVIVGGLALAWWLPKVY